MDKNTLVEAFTSDEVVALPDNATNGDVIKALFPKARIRYERYLVRMYFYDNATIEITFHKCWWDATYNKGEARW